MTSAKIREPIREEQPTEEGLSQGPRILEGLSRGPCLQGYIKPGRSWGSHS